MKVKQTFDGSDIFDWTTTGGEIVLTAPTTGDIDILVTAANVDIGFALVSFSDAVSREAYGVYDTEMDLAGATERLLQGTVEFSRGTTV